MSSPCRVFWTMLQEAHIFVRPKHSRSKEPGTEFDMVRSLTKSVVNPEERSESLRHDLATRSLGKQPTELHGCLHSTVIIALWTESALVIGPPKSVRLTTQRNSGAWLSPYLAMVISTRRSHRTCLMNLQRPASKRSVTSRPPRTALNHHLSRVLQHISAFPYLMRSTQKRWKN